MTNPIQIIKDWLNTEDEKMQEELSALVYYTHPLFSTKYSSGPEQKKIIDDYLDISLSPQETIQRTALMKGLINMALVGRKTDEDWEETKQRNIEAGNRIAEKHPNDQPFKIVEDFLASYEERKARWVQWSKRWDSIIGNDNFDRDAMYYMFFTRT